MRETAGQYWVTSRGTVQSIARLDPEAAEAAFTTPTGIVLGGWPGAVHGRAWASCAQFEQDLEAGRIDPDVRAVMYDPEGWDRTPLAERQDPVTSIHRFALLAREHGYFTIVTPHQGLVEVPGGAFTRAPDETKEEAYLRSGLAAEAARYADACEAQAQRLQRDPAAYREFVTQTAAQARRANPAVVVLSGLSTHPGYPATVEMLHAAGESVRDIVDGHYLSLGFRRRWAPEIAAQFLRLPSGR
ncbi:MAG TPA: hypothetical protein VGB19_15755 [Actinomycetota bacterium]